MKHGPSNNGRGVGRKRRGIHPAPEDPSNFSALVAIDIVIRFIRLHSPQGGSVAEWLACWTQAQKGPGSNRSRDAVG